MRAWDRNRFQPFSAWHSRRIRVYHAAGLSTSLRFVRLASRATSCTSAMWSLCLAPSLPLMVWLRCRFVRAATALFITSVVPRSRASAVIVVARFSIRLDFFIRFCHPLDIMLQHVLTSTVIVLRPFTPYFNSWCLLRKSIITPLYPLVVLRYAPLLVFAEGEGFEPPCHF